MLPVAAHQADNASTNRADRRFVEETGAAAEVAALAEPVLQELGLRLVRVLMSGRDGGTVQIMVDRAESDVTVEDCADASRAISPLLDAHDPIPGRYHLEVSSPGIDRPLVRPSDFEEWAGHEAKVMLREPVDGRKRFRGVIDGYDETADEVRLAVTLEGKNEPDILGFPAALIESAKLVMTDALLTASQARRMGSDGNGSDAPNGAGTE
jgi:ribosome maturation factor RimP